MKKLLYLLLLTFCIPFQVFAINGNGSFGTPYNGSLTSDMTWGGTVYVNGDIINNAYTLTVSAGSTIIFLTAGSDLIITGSGVLTAVGTSASMIRFTADYDNDGNYGETGERWGHISFQSMTGGFTSPSIINFCIVEFGEKNPSPFNFESAGGGIHTAYSYLTISNSLIRNNYAGYGGGIYVNANASPIISNCLISNNIAGTTGGGISIYQNSAAVVTNCAIFNNTCNGGGGGGGIFIGDYPDNVRVYNCVIASNISSVSPGNNIRIWKSVASTGPRLYNTVVWGSNNSINYLQLGLSSTDFNNCAIQGYTTGYTNCINLSATNSDPAGPNFYNVTSGSEDYRIQIVSPCRDAGTNSYSLPKDYYNNDRIGPYDIGIYEVQYNRWKTTAATTDWATASNWDGGVPSSSSDVVVPTGGTNYPTGSSTQDFTVGSGKYLIIEQGARVTLRNLTNNGILKLNSSSLGMASFILTSYSKGGGASEELQLFLTGGGTKTPLTYRWHYISSPVTSLAVSTFAPTYTLNVAQWVQDRPATSLTQGWVAYDGYIYSTGGMGGETFSSLAPGKGYNYFSLTDGTYTFGGQLNTGDVNAILAYKLGDDALWGYNLIGNPFLSGLDWDYITANSFPLNTTKTLYFTRNSVLCTYSNGVGVPGDVNGIIPPMQGFFSKTYSAGNTIVLAAAARTHNNVNATYKGSKSLIPLVRLALADSLLTDETVVRFDDLAKSYLDNDFDAVKMFLDPSLSSIHTSLAGTDYAINGLPFPETLIEIPVTVNIATGEETKSITASELQGLENYNVTLTDISTGFVANLSTTPTVTFAAAKGNVAGRFILKISTITTGLETPVTTNNKFNIYPANSNINIQTIADEWEGKSGSVRILDLTGKTISEIKNTEFQKNSLTQVASPGANGIYVVEIRAGNMRYVGKVVIR